jgi:hypothetical protein
MYALRSFQQKPSSQRVSQRKRLLLVSFAIWIIYSVAVLIEVWNIACRRAGRGVDAYPPWSRGINTALTLAYVFVGECLMVRSLPNSPKFVTNIISNISSGDAMLFGTGSDGWWLFLPYSFSLLSVRIPRFKHGFTKLTFAALGFVSVIDSVTRSLPPIAGALCIAFSVVTNLTITSLIIHKLLAARRHLINSEMYDHVPGFYRDLMVILIESAAPLALAGVCAIALSLSRISSKTSVEDSMTALYLCVLASNLLFLLFGVRPPAFRDRRHANLLLCSGTLTSNDPLSHSRHAPERADRTRH